MIINSNSTIQEIQEEFQRKFPGLAIAFYTKASQAYNASHKKDEYAKDTVISTISQFVDHIDIVLDENQCVKDFEKLLEKETALHVQVFRRSNDLWIQTTKTDDWTLGVQNGKGIRSQQN